MTELAELVKFGVIGDSPDKCPFCTSEAPPGDETLEMSDDDSEDVNGQNVGDDGDYMLHNCSGALADKLGGKPAWSVSLEFPTRKQPFYVYSGYYRGRPRKVDGKKVYLLQSGVCPNAHHLIPGNAALGRCKPLLKWMAATVIWKRVRYKKIAQIDSVAERKLVRGRTAVSIFDQDEDGDAVWIVKEKSSPTGFRETTEVQIAGKVYGKVEYNVNAASNGVWLPANNAVHRWSSVEPEVQREYARAAIAATDLGGQYRQFHDSHTAYSEEVKKLLSRLAKNIEKKAKDCMGSGSHTAGHEGKLPAPAAIKSSLNALSAKFRTFLVGSKTSWKRPWVTSDRSLDA